MSCFDDMIFQICAIDFVKEGYISILEMKTNAQMLSETAILKLNIWVIGSCLNYQLVSNIRYNFMQLFFKCVFSAQLLDCNANN